MLREHNCQPRISLGMQKFNNEGIYKYVQDRVFTLIERTTKLCFSARRKMSPEERTGSQE